LAQPMVFRDERRRGERRKPWRAVGADAHCQKLAIAVNAGNRTWHAYPSTQGRTPNARDRIGSGPITRPDEVPLR
jgi:hypothetical protein